MEDRGEYDVICGWPLSNPTHTFSFFLFFKSWLLLLQMSEEKDDNSLQMSELEEDDIPYEMKVDPDDDLADAKIHVRHAESRIHALRARIRKRSPRKADTTTLTMNLTSGRDGKLVNYLKNIRNIIL